jgi:hypothetical protein
MAMRITYTEDGEIHEYDALRPISFDCGSVQVVNEGKGTLQFSTDIENVISITEIPFISD